MNNALDQIECVPILSGQKPPYDIHSHPYCIDIITTYFHLVKLKFKNKADYLKVVKEGIHNYCLSNEINFNYHFDNRLPLIISPNTNNFQWFLGIQLSIFDVNKIKALLSFQQKRYLNEEIDFTTFVEFAVYKIVKNFTQIDNTKHLSTIMEWVNEQRILRYYSNNLEINRTIDKPSNIQDTEIIDFIINNPKKKAGTKKKKIIAPSFLLLGIKKDKDYFVTNAVDFMEAFKLLKGGGFVAEDTKYERFQALFKGEVIIRENRIEWTGKLKDLNRFVTFLLGTKIEKLKYKWETTSNCFFWNSVDILPKMLRKANGKNDNESKLEAIIQKL